MLMNGFLVSYEYGMGALWAIVKAESEAAIRRKFPELQVYTKKPDWMDSDLLDEIKSKDSFELHDSSTYPQWLVLLVNSRQKSRGDNAE
jgi:hypothetical protein